MAVEAVAVAEGSVSSATSSVSPDDELVTKMAKETEFFISFFVPERKHDDLHKAKTLWKLFLDANGRRYEGKSSRMKTILSDVVSLYPQHNRWSTPYIVSFPVPVSMIENGGAILTITGPAGSTTLSFKAVP